jgi:hypothetical protein
MSEARKPKLKLFVFDGFSPDYSGGLAFAIAKDETDARKQIIEKHGYNPPEWGGLTIHRLDRRLAYAKSGGG